MAVGGWFSDGDADFSKDCEKVPPHGGEERVVIVEKSDVVDTRVVRYQVGSHDPFARWNASGRSISLGRER